MTPFDLVLILKHVGRAEKSLEERYYSDVEKMLSKIKLLAWSEAELVSRFSGEVVWHDGEWKCAGNPNGWLFYCGPSEEYDGEILVSITSVEFWEKNGHWSDYHISDELVDILPSFLVECMEGVFETSLSMEETISRMKEIGFRTDPEYDKFCKNF
jgi:hypothetical protein